MSETETKSGWFSRLKAGLSKTSLGVSEGITGIFTKRRLDDEMLEELEELLIMTDMGAPTAAKLVAQFGEGRFDKEIEPAEVKEALAQQIAALLKPVAHPLDITPTKPHVILVVGVNGNGKTTTIGKMAAQLKQNDYNTVVAAADTFRAAAVEQLKIWASRVGVPVVSAEEGADPASVAYRAVEEAKQQRADVLLIDTAGRLHNKQNLMQELEKIIRVIRKVDETAPHTVLQILDGTTGQNAIAQVEAFKELVNVNGLVVTKLDGTAKGGVVVALAEKFKLPIHAIGIGEGVEDLKDFEPLDFGRSLMGVE